MANETIVEYSVKVVKADKNFYYYSVSVQPGGPKPENRKVGEPTKDKKTGEESQAFERVETNPPTDVRGQAMGIGQAMNIVNDVVYRAIEDAGMVK